MKTIIGPKQLQTFLKAKGFYKGKIDGLFGPKSQQAAIDYVVSFMGPQGNWQPARFVLAATQSLFVELKLAVGNIDGRWGPNTEYALEQYQNLMRDIPASEEEQAQQRTVWPRYRDMERFYGPVGQNVIVRKLPYPMRLAWDDTVTVSEISLHKKCAESAIGVLERVRDDYGLANLRDLRLNLFGGSLNVRKMRGGDNWSTHSWAAAIDIDPAHNAFRWNDSRASLDESVYDKWWKFWEAEGWVSLGRERNYDWMHVQAVRL